MLLLWNTQLASVRFYLHFIIFLIIFLRLKYGKQPYLALQLDIIYYTLYNEVDETAIECMKLFGQVSLVASLHFCIYEHQIYEKWSQSIQPVFLTMQISIFLGISFSQTHFRGTLQSRLKVCPVIITILFKDTEKLLRVYKLV